MCVFVWVNIIASKQYFRLRFDCVNNRCLKNCIDFHKNRTENKVYNLLLTNFQMIFQPILKKNSPTKCGRVNYDKYCGDVIKKLYHRGHRGKFCIFRKCPRMLLPVHAPHTVVRKIEWSHTRFHFLYQYDLVLKGCSQKQW